MDTITVRSYRVGELNRDSVLSSRGVLMMGPVSARSGWQLREALTDPPSIAPRRPYFFSQKQRWRD